MKPKATRARLQKNTKISTYLETVGLTEDVFGECGRTPWRGDTPHTREPLTMSTIKNYRGFWFPYKNCRGGQISCGNYGALPPWFLVTYKNYCGDQLPCNNYRALPWWLATVQSIPWLPITVHQLLCNTVVAVYRGKHYRDEKSLPWKAREIYEFMNFGIGKGKSVVIVHSM